MTISWQIPRNCLAWILLSQIALIAPHAERLPWWVLVTYFCSAAWRIMVYQGRWSLAPAWVKIILSALCFVGIYRSYGSLVGLEPTVALLFSGFSLKLLELANKRDVYVIIFLAYFVALTEFLFTQAFLISLYVFFTVFLVSATLVALHQPGYDKLNIISIRKAFVIFLQAVPVMVLLFLVFPRFDPLWTVPIPSHQAKTGMSDNVSPGDISRLSQSGELVFRATFHGEVPPKRELYWRGFVLSEFDGRSWRRDGSAYYVMPYDQRMKLYGQMEDPIHYSIIQEATYQSWIFSLALAHSFDSEIRSTMDYRLMHTSPIHSQILYDVTSDQKVRLQPQMDAKTRKLESRLPEGSNPRTLEYARGLFDQTATHREYVDRVLMEFRQQPFYYTLNPPLLGEHSVDEFLFDTRRGFCEHYASSFVFLMRAVGVPARVVAGYQGGEINPVTGTVLIHQFDAHAWAEVWMAGEGWVRVDPTGAVAPARIESGLEEALGEEGSFLADQPFSALRYRNIQWLNKIRMQLDAFNYYWATWVLDYDGDRQSNVLSKILGEVTALRVGLLLLGVGGCVLAIVSYGLMRGRGKPKLEPEVKIYLRLCKRLQKAGFERQLSEGPIEYARRIAELQPAWKKHLLAATRAFVSLSYEPLPADQRGVVLKQLRSEAFKVSYQLRIKAQ